MAVTAQSGVFSFGCNAGGAKGGAVSTYYKHRASDIDLGVVSDDRLGPPEVGGEPVPTIPYRAGVMAAGGALLNPRLENTLGWLLYGSMGAVTTSADKDCTGTTGATVTGMYRHEFKYATDKGYVPYMSMRKLIPGTNTTTDFGETYTDCKIVSLTLALPNDGLVAARVDAIGRSATFTNTVSGWTYGNTQYEDYQSIPIGVVTEGFLKLPNYSASELPIVAATVTLTNAPLDIRQERVFGDPYLQDITVVGRSITADFVLKWDDPYLYQKIITAGTGGTFTQWTSAPWVSDFDVMAYAATKATGTTPLTAWQTRVYVPAMMFQVAGGIRLAGNQSVAMRLTGTGIASTSTLGYGSIFLGNKITQYVWP